VKPRGSVVLAFLNFIMGSSYAYSKAFCAGCVCQIFIRALTFGLTFRNNYADSVCEIENDDEIIREGACTLMLANLFRGFWRFKAKSRMYTA